MHKWPLFLYELIKFTNVPHLKFPRHSSSLKHFLWPFFPDAHFWSRCDHLALHFWQVSWHSWTFSTLMDKRVSTRNSHIIPSSNDEELLCVLTCPFTARCCVPRNIIPKAPQLVTLYWHQDNQFCFFLPYPPRAEARSNTLTCLL